MARRTRLIAAATLGVLLAACANKRHAAPPVEEKAQCRLGGGFGCASAHNREAMADPAAAHEVGTPRDSARRDARHRDYAAGAQARPGQ